MSNFERKYDVILDGVVLCTVVAPSADIAKIRGRVTPDMSLVVRPIDVVFNTELSGYADDYPWRTQGDDYCITIPNSRSKSLEIRVSPNRYHEWHEAIRLAKENFKRGIDKP